MTTWVGTYRCLSCGAWNNLDREGSYEWCLPRRLRCTKCHRDCQLAKAYRKEDVEREYWRDRREREADL